MTGLTDAQRIDRTVTGGELQRLVTDLAAILGYEWVHFRAAETKRGWRVPVEGPLGAGWPDLVLVNWRRERIVFAELKREIGDVVTPEQDHVHAVLREAGAEVHVWRPSDLTEGRIQAVLS